MEKLKHYIDITIVAMINGTALFVSDLSPLDLTMFIFQLIVMFLTAVYTIIKIYQSVGKKKNPKEK